MNKSKNDEQTIEHLRSEIHRIKSLEGKFEHIKVSTDTVAVLNFEMGFTLCAFS